MSRKLSNRNESPAQAAIAKLVTKHKAVFSQRKRTPRTKTHGLPLAWK